MAVELLGPNLEEVKEFCQGSFSHPTIIAIAEQLITRIEYFHSKNYLHRDIKPENFMLGRERKPKIIYIIDYGLSKRYRDSTTKMHIPYKNNKRLTGTARYASVNTHMGIEQSRRDDLECIAFTLIYLAKGKLPWQGITADNKIDKYQKVLERKKGISVELLCKDLPGEFAHFLHYCRSLRFEDKPDYAMLRKRFADLFYKGGYNKKFDYSWNELKLDFDSLLERGHSEVKEEEEEEKIEQTIQIKSQKKEISLVRYTTIPSKVENPLAKSKKMPIICVTKKLKQMKKEFLETVQKESSDKDEIPDENEGAVNTVRHLECPVNYIQLKNKKSFRAKLEKKERNKSFDCVNSIVIHKQRVNNDIRKEIYRQSTVSLKPLRRLFYNSKKN